LVDGLRSGKVTTCSVTWSGPSHRTSCPTSQPGATLDQLLDVANYYDTVFAKAQQLPAATTSG